MEKLVNNIGSHRQIKEAQRDCKTTTHPCPTISRREMEYPRRSCCQFRHFGKGICHAFRDNTSTGHYRAGKAGFDCQRQGQIQGQHRDHAWLHANAEDEIRRIFIFIYLPLIVTKIYLRLSPVSPSFKMRLKY